MGLAASAAGTSLRGRWSPPWGRPTIPAASSALPAGEEGLGRVGVEGRRRRDGEGMMKGEEEEKEKERGDEERRRRWEGRGEEKRGQEEGKGGGKEEGRRG